jgi:hypothetical protein
VVVVGVDDHAVHLVGEGVDLAGAAQGDRLLAAAPDEVAVGCQQRHRLPVPAAGAGVGALHHERRDPALAGAADEHGHRVLRLGQPVGDELGVGDVDVGEADVQPGSFLVRARRAMIIWENDARPGRG